MGMAEGGNKLYKFMRPTGSAGGTWELVSSTARPHFFNVNEVGAPLTMY